MLAPETLKVTETGVRNLLKHFGILEGEIVTREAQGLPATRLMEVPNPEYYHMVLGNGVYGPFFDLGSWVDAGQVLGQVHSVEDICRPPETIIAQCSGTLLGLRSPARVARGDCAGELARDLESSAQQFL
jgi:predicted deacylase